MTANTLSKYQRTQAAIFFRKIYSEPMKGGGVIIDSADFHNRALCHSINGMITQACNNIKNTGVSYVSANVFKAYNSGYFRRTEQFLWRLGHIIIDIDYQGSFSHDYAALEEQLEQNICWHCKNSGIPMPNYIVFTGSGGCHLYYVFESLPNGVKKQMVHGVQVTKIKLAARWVEAEKYLEPYGPGYKVDIGSMDASRVLRVPGSAHEDTGRISYMKPTGQPKYRYKDLCALLEDKPWNGVYAVMNANRDIDRSRNGYGKKSHKLATFFNSHHTTKWLGAKRLAELFSLARQGWGFQNCREKTAHLAWIWARDAGLSTSECEEKLKCLNKLFYAPLSNCELLHTARGNDKSYRYTNERIRFELGLNGSEGYFVGHPSREFKDRAGKAKRHKKLIAAFVLMGKKIREIADELKLSVSLIKRRRSEIKKSEGFSFWADIKL